jgi:hypothetical protein
VRRRGRSRSGARSRTAATPGEPPGAGTDREIDKALRTRLAVTCLPPESAKKGSTGKIAPTANRQKDVPRAFRGEPRSSLGSMPISARTSVSSAVSGLAIMCGALLGSFRAAGPSPDGCARALPPESRVAWRPRSRRCFLGHRRGHLCLRDRLAEPRGTRALRLDYGLVEKRSSLKGDAFGTLTTIKP